MKPFVIVAAVLLTGCASKEPGIEVQTVPVTVTRIVSCLDAADIPKRPAGLGRRPSSDARVLADLLLAKVRSWELYGDKADAVLKGCTKAAPDS